MRKIRPLRRTSPPPSAITTLEVTGHSATSVLLTWVATGDDGNEGTADDYDIRFSTEHTTEWGDMTEVSGESDPHGAGSVESFLVAGLAIDTDYYFEMKVCDDAGNWSDASNRASGRTLDPTAPAVIADLVAGSPTNSSILLSWTAVGDDGTEGQASYYDVRYSTSPSHSWDDMTQVTGEPDPQPPGSSEQFTVTGLESATLHYFRIKAGDEQGNWSGLSNSASAETVDEVAPAAVANLDAVGMSSSSIRLSWTAVGDDGNEGQAAGYDVRYSTSQSTSWESMTQAGGEPAPGPSGSSETFTVSSLASNTRYYFRIKVYDDSNNWSGLSNQASAETYDDTPPAAVSDLDASGLSTSSIRLTWTAVGDDGHSGQASEYDIRYSTSSSTSWSSMTRASGEPSPDPSGSGESFTVSGLGPGTMYYFRMKVADERDNWSGVSNTASAETDEAQTEYLYYDDGGFEGSIWATAYGAYALVYFTLPSGWNQAEIYEIKIYVADNPDDLTLKVWDSFYSEGRYWPDGIVASPGNKYCNEGWNAKSGSWVINERHFFVGVTWPQLYRPELGADTGSYCAERSCIGNGSNWSYILNGDLGIRVKVRSTSTPQGGTGNEESVTMELRTGQLYTAEGIDASFDVEVE